jgi:hypothetical protein
LPFLAAPVAFAAFSCFFSLPLDTGFLKESTTTYFTDYTGLLYLFTESFQQALKAFPIMKFYLGQLESTPSINKITTI